MPALRSSSLNQPIAAIVSIVSGVERKPFSLSSVAFTSTITRIVCLLVWAGLIGLTSERRMRFSDADIFLQILDGSGTARARSRAATDSGRRAAVSLSGRKKSGFSFL
jgi:hypothetical protein